MGYFKKPNLKKIDYIILEIMFILICAGLYCIFHISASNPKKSDLFTKQLLGFVLGFITIVVIQFFDYRFICKLSPILYLGICAVLAYTFKRGLEVNHVRRWIPVAGISLQPSELAKIILILFLAFLCNVFKEKQKKFYPVFILAAATALPAFLILKEPHLSPCIVLAVIFCIVVLVSGISYKVIMTLVVIIAPLLATIFIGVGVFNWNIPLIKPYMVKRVLIHFTDGDAVDNTAGKYQQDHSISAIEAGGAYGKALTKDNTNKNYQIIYSNESDFIFAGIAEEYGFVGCCILIFLYLIMVLRCLKIAAHAPDLMGRIIATAVSSLLTFQAFIHLGVTTDILPNTGMPFPFISYGLTNLVSSMIAIGLVINIGQDCKNN